MARFNVFTCTEQGQILSLSIESVNLDDAFYECINRFYRDDKFVTKEKLDNGGLKIKSEINSDNLWYEIKLHNSYELYQDYRDLSEEEKEEFQDLLKLIKRGFKK